MTEAKIDINQASEETLAALPGVGEAKARRIIEFRERNQPFEEVIELTAVKGITERMVRRFEHLVTVEATIPASTQLLVVAEDEPATAEPEPDTADPDADTAPLPLIPAAATAAEPEEESRDGAEAVVTPLRMATAVSPESRADDRVEDEPAETADLDAETAPWPPVASAPEPDRAAAPSPAPAPDQTAANKAAQRRGQRAALIGAVSGILGGVLLTLLILFLLNGTLNYAAENRALQQQIIEAEATRSVMERDLNALAAALDGNMGSLSERLDTADTRLSQTNDNLASLDGELSQAQRDIGSLYETSETLDERLAGVAAAADTFNIFLDGLRDLLFDLQGPPPVVTPTATITPTTVITPIITITPTLTPTPDTDAENDSGENGEAEEIDEDELEETMTPTPTLLPTRTPRSTATPIGDPSVTPTP
ncbi:MAG: helix-hairpin-helix domain-containing protein [Chloroflexota bacterium]